jgi:phosphoribosylformylglycinamidine synthase
LTRPRDPLNGLSHQEDPMPKPRVAVIRAAGTNCDAETAYAFQLVGAETETFHVNRLREDPKRLRDFQVLAIPGGFSYGDDVASGRIFANELMTCLRDELLALIARGGFAIGICNGFQVLTKAGLLPRLDGAGAGAGAPAVPQGHRPAGTGNQQQATLTDNTSGVYRDCWVRATGDPRLCQWIADDREVELPVAHAEGRFVAPPAVIDRLAAAGQIALRYSSGTNPNGSTADIAGVCDPTGRVFGLMPHPERFLRWENHPRWTREVRHAEGDGVRFFRTAIAHLS